MRSYLVFVEIHARTEEDAAAWEVVGTYDARSFDGACKLAVADSPSLAGQKLAATSKKGWAEMVVREESKPRLFVEKLAV